MPATSTRMLPPRRVSALIFSFRRGGTMPSVANSPRSGASSATRPALGPHHVAGKEFVEHPRVLVGHVVPSVRQGEIAVGQLDQVRVREDAPSVKAAERARREYG